MIVNRYPGLPTNAGRDRKSSVGPHLHTDAAPERGLAADRTRIARLPIHFFVVAIAFFALAVGAAPWVVGDLIDYFYQPLVLALTHAITLGWITSAMMGVMYRYVPALTKRPLRFPRLGLAQFWLFVVGVTGMVVHFAIGRWVATWLAAAVVVVSAILFALNMLPSLVPVVGRGNVAETGMLLAILYLLVSAVLGLLLGLDKTFGFLRGSLLTNLAGHAHLAALGWVSLTICAVSYRIVPAFLLPVLELPRAAMWQLYGLAFAVAGLGVALMGGTGGVSVWSGAVTVALLAYVAVLGSLVRGRRMPIDWTMRHALAGLGALLLSAGLGLSLIWIDPGSALGNGVAGAYGVLGLLGWVTNFIVGMSYQLFAGFIVGLRMAAGWPRLTTAELSLPRYRPFVFFSLNAGVLALASGLITGQVLPARVGATLVTVGGLVYIAIMARTLSYAYRSSVPPASSGPLRVLPDGSS